MQRSPFFYVGDKYKLLKSILPLFPNKINKFIEPFCGGGSVFLNVNANEYFLNDININLIMLHKLLKNHNIKKDDFFEKVFNIVEKYELSISSEKDIIPIELKEKYKKNYYAQFNKIGYLKMREDFNKNPKDNFFLLYLLLIYGFNRMLRFNKNGKYNVPVGNVDFNKNVKKALLNYFNYTKINKIKFFNLDYLNFFNKIKIKKDDFIYLDPPYLITSSEYNKIWSIEKEKKLLNFLNKLNNNKIKFAISNVLFYKDKHNDLFDNWSKNYNIYNIKSNYINYHDNKQKKIKEVLVTNYD